MDSGSSLTIIFGQIGQTRPESAVDLKMSEPVSIDLQSEEEILRMKAGAGSIPKRKVLTLNAWNRLHPSGADEIHVRNLSANMLVGVDAWGRRKEQPVRVSITIRLAESFDKAASSDNVEEATVNYGSLSKRVLQFLNACAPIHIGLSTLMNQVDSTIDLITSAAVDAQIVEIVLPKASALGSGVRLQGCHFLNDVNHNVMSFIHIEDLKIPAIIGLNAHERIAKQLLVVNIWVSPAELASPLEPYAEINEVTVKVSRFFSPFLEQVRLFHRTTVISIVVVFTSVVH